MEIFARRSDSFSLQRKKFGSSLHSWERKNKREKKLFGKLWVPYESAAAEERIKEKKSLGANKFGGGKMREGRRSETPKTA